MVKNKNKNTETSELEITVVAKKESWKQEQKKAYNKLAKELSLKGFRKGHVPPEVAKRNISNEKVFAEAIQPTLETLVKEANAEIPKDLVVLDVPSYGVEKLSDVELEVKFIYPIYPDVKLPDYKKINVKYEEKKFDKKIVQTEIEKIAESRSTLKVKENGSIKTGDVAIITYKGKVNGKEFEGNSAENFELVIGSNQLVKGFEDQLIGSKKDDKKDVKVTFPKDYHSKELANKDVVFKVEVNEIKEKDEPKWDKEFIESLNVPGVKTKEELEKYIEKVFKQQIVDEARGKFKSEAFAILLRDLDIKIPVQLVGKEMKRQEETFSNQLKEQNMTLEKYSSMVGMKLEEIRVQFRDQAVSRLKESLVFAEIAKSEEIELTDNDYEKEYKKLSKVYNQPVESIKGMVTKEQMQIPMTNDRVIDVLIKFSKEYKKPTSKSNPSKKPAPKPTENAKKSNSTNK